MLRCKYKYFSFGLLITVHCRNYDILGLNYKLKLREILFNKWLALLKVGKKREGAAVLQTIIEGSPPPELEAMINKVEKNPEEGIPFSLVSRTSIHVTAPLIN